MTAFCLPLTTLPVCSSGCPGSFMCPFSPSSLNHAIHFSMVFCICSGEGDTSLPRNRYVNSLMRRLLILRKSSLQTFEGPGAGQLFCPNRRMALTPSYPSALGTDHMDGAPGTSGLLGPNQTAGLAS